MDQVIFIRESKTYKTSYDRGYTKAVNRYKKSIRQTIEKCKKMDLNLEQTLEEFKRLT